MEQEKNLTNLLEQIKAIAVNMYLKTSSPFIEEQTDKILELIDDYKRSMIL